MTVQDEKEIKMALMMHLVPIMVNNKTI